jgi:hypothetical protein
MRSSFVSTLELSEKWKRENQDGTRRNSEELASAVIRWQLIDLFDGSFLLSLLALSFFPLSPQA